MRKPLHTLYIYIRSTKIKIHLEVLLQYLPLPIEKYDRSIRDVLYVTYSMLNFGIQKLFDELF